MGKGAGDGLAWLDHFEDLPDPRQQAKVLYPLPEILLTCLCGAICGAESWVEVEAFGTAKLDFLRRFLPFEHGVPSHDTFGDVFAALDAERFQQAFIAWVGALQADIREVVAVDGKTLRRAFDRRRGRGPIHMVAARASAQRLVLGQERVAAKENEIAAIPQLLALLTLEGAIVTVDAIGCQKAIARAILDGGADCVLRLKGNQPALLRAVELFLAEQRSRGFADCAPGSWACHETTDADHGRIEVRRHWITSDIAWLRERHPAWPGMTSIAVRESARDDGAKPTVKAHYYITSLPADADLFAHAARTHWSIENGLHWVMDVVFREDECRIRRKNGPANFATLRRLAQNLLQRAPAKASLRVRRKRAGWDHGFLQQVLAAA